MIEGMHNNVQIIPIPAFKDNYIWLIHNGQQAVAIDPGDATVVMQTLKQLQLSLNGILITHHHQDHTAGVADLLIAYPSIAVHAPKLEAYPFTHTSVSEADTVKLDFFDLSFSVMLLPGHTLGHVAYLSNPRHCEQLLFCGDTLFGAGCGRLFEGSPAQMHHSLQRLANLAPSTKVYCSHEYTLRNIEFAMSLEPTNIALHERKLATQRLRDTGLPSLPSSIALELATNPFLRCDSLGIQAASGLKSSDQVAVFSRVRELRNSY
ncbi:MAG: hydroxyacylglutathione hydrolase [Methylotenera sp.]|nr:hydroxyacylglutathione hydrolase [Methylotenera sp.]